MSIAYISVKYDAVILRYNTRGHLVSVIAARRPVPFEGKDAYLKPWILITGEIQLSDMPAIPTQETEHEETRI